MIGYQLISIIILCSTQQSFTFRRTPIDLPLLCLILLSLSSALLSLHSGLNGIILFSTILIHCANFYLSVKVSDRNFKELFINLLVLISILFSLSILAQYALKNLGILFFPNANLLAGYLSCGIIALFAKNSFDTSVSNRKWLKIFLHFSFLLMILAQILIFSRGAFISLFFGFMILLSSNRRKTLIPLLWTASFVLMIFLIFPKQIRISKMVLPEDYGRMTIWKTALSSLSQKPVLGWGLGNFNEAYELNKLPMRNRIGQYEGTTRFAHNEFLQAAVETGFAGLVLFLWIIGIICKNGIEILKSRETDWGTLASLGCITALLVHSCFDFNLHLPVLAFLLLFFTSSMLKKSDETFHFHRPKLLSIFFLTWLAAGSIIMLSYGPLQIAKKHLENSRKADAKKYFKTAFLLNPFNAESAVGLSEISNELLSEKLLKWAIFLNRGNASLHAQLARHYFLENRLEDSASSYLSAIKKSPKNPFYCAELSDLFLRRNQWQEALVYLNKAIVIEPFYCFAHFRLGEIYLSLGDKQKALSFFLNAIRIKEANLSPGSDYSKRLLEFDSESAKSRISQMEKKS